MIGVFGKNYEVLIEVMEWPKKYVLRMCERESCALFTYLCYLLRKC
jgi:hypothetical protein